MKNPSQVTKIYVLCGLTLAIIAAVGIFLVYPYYTKTTVLKKEIYDQRVQLAIFQQQRINTESTMKDYNQIKNDTANISKIFINKKEVVNFVTTLEENASAHSLKQSILLDNSSKTANSPTLSLKITLDGTWQDYINYLADLEKMNFYLSTYEMNINAANNSVNVVLNTTAYTQ